jgi:hypothetical protein
MPLPTSKSKGFLTLPDICLGTNEQVNILSHDLVTVSVCNLHAPELVKYKIYGHPL